MEKIIKDSKEMTKFENQEETIILCDLSTYSNTTTGIRDIFLCDRDNLKNTMKKLKCPAEYIGLFKQQIKPVFDLDKKVPNDEHFDENEYIEYIKSLIKIVLNLINYDDINLIYREVRYEDDKKKYSYHFIVDKIRINIFTLKALIIEKGFNNIFDMKIYDKNRGLYCLYTDKKKITDNKGNKKIISVGEFKIYGDPKDDIYIYFPSYILNTFDDYDEKYKHLIKNDIPKGPKEETPTNIFNKILSNVQHLSDAEKDLIKNLIDCLDVKRAEDYGDWLNLGWCLYNINSSDFCFELWDNFSKLGSTYTEGECFKLWNTMKKSNMSIGSLKYWAKNDNPTKYKEIINTSLIKYIDDCINTDGRHYDVAYLIAKYKQDEIVYDKKTFFTINENCIWKKQNDETFFTSLCGYEISKIFRERAIYFITESQKYIQQPDKRIIYDEKTKKCLKIAQQLGNSGYCKSIREQIPALTLVEDFLETKIDENISLFAFNNCVFDMVKCEIRPIQPNDYISITTGYDYCDHPDQNIIDEIYKWFNKWFNTEEMVEYVLNVLASTMYGKNTEQAFYIWTGSASNGKSFLQDFMANMMGKYTLKVNTTTFTIPSKGQNQNTEMYEGKGKRYTYAEEPEDTTTSENKIIASRMKEYSGDCVMKTKGLYKDPISWKPQFRIFISCNNIPEISSCDDGVRRRIKIIDFPNVFKEKPRDGKLAKYGDENKPYYEYGLDITMKEKKDDIKYIQAFAYILIKRWGKHIKYNTIIKVPESVELRSNEYMDACNAIKSFMETKYTRVDNLEEKIHMTEIFNAFKFDNIDNKKVKRDKFIDELKKLGYIVKFYDGISYVYKLKAKEY